MVPEAWRKPRDRATGDRIGSGKAAGEDGQRQRRRDYHRQKIASDPVYQQVCVESPRKWRAAHAAYWKKYRQNHPEQVERNRRKQRLRDEKRRLANLANNNLAICQVPIFQSPDSSGLVSTVSCKQQPSGIAPAADL
jgi:hypothetical protein